MFVYVLKLEHGKWYVGQCPTTEGVLDQFSDTVSGWCHLHRPIELHSVHEEPSEFDLDAYIREFMAVVGGDDVRGGSYVEVPRPVTGTGAGTGVGAGVGAVVGAGVGAGVRPKQRKRRRHRPGGRRGEKKLIPVTN